MRHASSFIPFVASFAGAVTPLCANPPQTGCAISLVSRDANGNVPPVASAVTPALTTDGRYVAFESDIKLIPSDPSANRQVYRLDRESGDLIRVSRSINGGGPASGLNVNATISADGNSIAFDGAGDDLVVGDTNGKRDIFVLDVGSGITERLSVSSTGQQSDQNSAFPSISANGRRVAFVSPAHNLAPGNGPTTSDIFLRDRNLGATILVSCSSSGVAGNRDSNLPSLSADGRFCAFVSRADNLVPGDTNLTQDVFVRDLRLRTTTRVSVSSGGVQAHGDASWLDISGDGRIVAFTSPATDLVGGDTNGASDVFVHELATGLTELASRNSAGVQGNGGSSNPRLSFDGSRVAFTSHATNLAAGNTNSIEDIFVRDRAAGTTECWSLAWDGAQAAWFCTGVDISADGLSVAFWSSAGNLVPGDGNGGFDVFVRDCRYAGDQLYGTAKVNSLGCTPVIESDGAPSWRAGAGFHVRAREVVNAAPGLLLYSLAGPAATPFGGGTLLLGAPIRRTLAQQSGGTPPPASDCSGTYALDFNVRIASGVDPALVAGQAVWTQYWSRDTGFAPPNDMGLSQGLTFTIGF